MPPFSQLSPREKRLEILRWLSLLPAAILADYAAAFVCGALVRIAGPAGAGILGGSAVADGLALFLYYAPPKTAFVLAGAATAPRRRLTTAIALTILGVTLSLLKHVVGQHLAGNRVGFTNYSHLAAESTGLLSATAFLLLQSARNRRQTTGAVERKPD